MLKKEISRLKRKKSIRKKVSGSPDVPRLVVHRTNRSIDAQIIDDSKSLTIVGLSSRTLKSKQNKTATAVEFGKVFGQKAKTLKVNKVVFDRAGYKYHGRVKAFADAVREAGIQF